MIFLKKAWAWLKKYWKVIALVVGAIVALVLLRGRQVSFAEDFKKIQEAHEEELKAIEAAREEERRLNAQALERLQSTLAVVEDEYNRQKLALDSKKKKEIAQIVKEDGHDPEALAKRLSEATGFQIIIPNDQ